MRTSVAQIIRESKKHNGAEMDVERARAFAQQIDKIDANEFSEEEIKLLAHGFAVLVNAYGLSRVIGSCAAVVQMMREDVPDKVTWDLMLLSLRAAQHTTKGYHIFLEEK